MKTAAAAVASVASTVGNTALWDAHAPVYEQVLERSTTLWGRDALVLGQLPSPTATTSPRFLDVACGTGAFTVAAATLGFDVTATDFSPGMVARLQQKIAVESPTLQLTARVVDGQTLDGLNNDSFDVVSSIFGLFMFPDRAAAWRSVWRVLKPGGRVLVTSWDLTSVNLRMGLYVSQRTATTPEASAGSERQKETLAANRMLQAASFREELEEFGFTDIHIHSVSHPLCFQSGQEFVSARMMVGSDAQARAMLDFMQCELDGVDPFSDAALEAAQATVHMSVESHSLWRRPFAVQALGHIAVATKPASQ